MAVALAIAGGAGNWFARMQYGAAPATASSAAGVVAATPPAGQGAGAGEGAEKGSGKDYDRGSGQGERRILYYRNPMGLPDTSPVPKKDSMGMDYLPVYADDRPDDVGTVVVSPARIQTLGVRTAAVERCAPAAASNSTSAARWWWRRASRAGSSACR